MQRPSGSWNIGEPGGTYARYNESFQWSHNFRSQGAQAQRNNQFYDYQHWCETCDKGFTTQRFLDNHTLQHQKCNIDGCQFVAHPKIITKHIQMQHSTGLFKRISKLNNPDEIQKWRDERKKKYPTVENIKKKEAEMKEKIIRGEKMGINYGRGIRNNKLELTNKFHHRHSQTRKANYPQDKYKNTNNRNRDSKTDRIKKSAFPKKICKIVHTTDESRTLKPFAGIQLCQIGNDMDEEIEHQHPTSVPIEYDEDLQNSETLLNKTNTTEPTVCSALTSLMDCYGSSDEGDDGDIHTQSNKIMKPFNGNKAKTEDFKTFHINTYHERQLQNMKKSNDTEKKPEYIKGELKDSKSTASNYQDANDNDSGPEETKINKEETSLPVDKILKIKSAKELPNKINRPMTKKCVYMKKSKLPSTLLEKLLYREIQHERNVILQCVRYVIKNKYFDKSHDVFVSN